MDYHIHGQFILISIICTFVSLILLIENVYRINTLQQRLKKEKKDKQKLLDKITKACVSVPIKLYITQIGIPLIITPIILFAIGAEPIVVFKISTVFILFMSVSATLTYVFSQSEFKKIVTSIYEENPDYTNKIISTKPRISMKGKLLLELIPLIIVSLLFTSLLAYTMNARTTGYIYNKIYSEQLKQFNAKQYFDLNELLSDLKAFDENDNDIEKFIIREDGIYTTINNTNLSEFFIKYALNNQNSNRTYDYYCIDREGTFTQINTEDGNQYLVGVAYETNSLGFLATIIISFTFLLLLIIITLLYITTSLSRDTKMITRGLNKIIKKKDITHGLIVTSNDETGELTDSFNKIQKMTQENIRELNEKQELIVRQGKLSILGEMAGGLAHDINNPASAINMSINCLYDIDDKEEKKKILDNMKECTKRILTIVSSIRDQFRNLGETKKELFTFNEVMKNIEVVIHNQLTKYNCELKIEYDKDFKIYGERNKLNQVISNIIMNSILAYKDCSKSGLVEVDVLQDKNYNIIAVKDEAGGIPEKIRDKLFSQILTTRGVQGTGLGLYLAKSIIEDEFDGKIGFETTTGKGTIFYIRLKKAEG